MRRALPFFFFGTVRLIGNIQTEHDFLVCPRVLQTPHEEVFSHGFDLFMEFLGRCFLLVLHLLVGS